MSKNPFRADTVFSDNVAESVDYLLTALSRAWKENKCICQLGKDDMPRTTRRLLNGDQSFQGLRVGAPNNLGLIRKIERFEVTAPAVSSLAHGSSSSQATFDSAHSELGHIAKGSSVTVYRDKWDDDLELHYWIDHDDSGSNTGELKTRIYNPTATGTGAVSLLEGVWYITVITYGD